MASEPNVELYEGASSTTVILSVDDLIYLLDAGTGAVVGTIDIESDVETILADEGLQRILVPDEKAGRGIFAFAPDGSALAAPLDEPFGGGHFDSDAEGITMFVDVDSGGLDTGRGLVIVSDQRSDTTDFEVFDRADRRHLGTLRLAGVSNTDGVTLFQTPLPGYPAGVLAAIDDDGSVAVVGWDVIERAIGWSR